ncbi:MAG: carbamoyltransferase HypF [Alphaproteobacteria bacterium]
MTQERHNIVGRHFRIRGLVQGVGFRPHVWLLAREAGLSGQVLNDGEGVEIEAWGTASELDAFTAKLTAEAPPLASITNVQTEVLLGTAPPSGDFIIAPSAHGAITTGIVPDAATCPACLEEILDPNNRRYRYAFTNCTHCGPRLSIIRGIPYDRASTSMSAFPMCPACQAEYEDPADRRFHAQPNACPVCGPRLWLEDHSGKLIAVDPIAETARLLLNGAIVAIKGIGGFHLACDATNTDAVAILRQRKHRDAKPFAVMVCDLTQARLYAAISDAEIRALESPAAPIVLVKMAGMPLAAGIAPGHDHLGLMLPYTPLHHLLMRETGCPLVMTSGNLSSEPQVTSNNEAKEKLSGIADAWLMHDRDIVNRLDDAVMRIDAPGPAILRRARGLAPQPLPLPDAFKGSSRVLAMGGELKSTFCLLKDGQAILSQHMGDLEDATTHADYRKTQALYRQIFDFSPEVIAIDHHPNYLSSQWGNVLAAETGAAVVAIQHHHAHLVACLGENGIDPDAAPALGIILDGLGLGDDGTIWGGELLLGGYDSYKRVGHFVPVALPGGEQAIREPWRNAFAHIRAAFGEETEARLAGTDFGAFLADKPLTTLDKMIARGINAPLSSSAGRLFDAVAALTGICCERQSYEGQAGMQLEAAARPFLASETAYPLTVDGRDPLVLSWRPLWLTLLEDLSAEVPAGRVAARFHLALVAGLADAANRIASQHGVRRVILSGGVMQNQILLEGLFQRLREEGFEVLTHSKVPPNDGGLSLGQALFAARVNCTSVSKSQICPD